MPNTEPKTQSQLHDSATDMLEHLAKHTQGEWGSMERPDILARMLEVHPDEDMNITSDEFEAVASSFIAFRAAALVAPYVGMHACLVSNGYISAESKFEFCNDGYVWAVPARGAKGEAAAIVLETQSRSFIIVLNKSFGQWNAMHLREFWPDFNDDVAQGGLLRNISDLRERTDLTIQDIVAWSTKACAYSDDLPSVSYPARPSLNSFLKGSLLAGQETAGIGLENGNHSDKGYVLSVFLSANRSPHAAKLVYAPHRTISFVAQYMASAFHRLGRS
jgi:hypothetical protein